MGLFNKKSDLTTPEAVAKSQKVYDGIVTGKVKDAKRELKKVHEKKRGK